MITDVSIPSYALETGSSKQSPTPQRGSSQKAAVYYRIRVEAPPRSWISAQRYSAFLELDQQLRDELGSDHPPPCPLPSKQILWTTLLYLSPGYFPFCSSPASSAAPDGSSRRPADQSDQFTDERYKAFLDLRAEHLQAYLRAILASPDPRWRTSRAFNTFLDNLPTTSSASAQSASHAASLDAKHITPTGWLDLHHALNADIQRLKPMLLNANASLTFTEHAKLKRRIGELEKQHRTLVDSLAQISTPQPQHRPQPFSLAEKTRRDELLRDVRWQLQTLIALLEAKSQQSARSNLAKSPSSQQAAQVAGSAPGRARVFGRIAETEVTAPLETDQLLQLQQIQLKSQDASIDVLADSIANQNRMALAINEELAQQRDIISHLDRAVDQTSDRLQKTNKSFKRLR